MTSTTDTHTPTEPPPRIREGLARQRERLSAVETTLAALPSHAAATPNIDGEIEKLGAVKVVHRFVRSPGDSETIRWHFAECGPPTADTVVFLHGLPDSWWQWHYVLEALAGTYHCLAVDLKGYGQSDKRTGDYRQAGVASQLHALLDEIGVGRFSLITHDRGSVVADHLVADMRGRVMRYGRGQQHLWHLHPDLHPQESLLTATDAPALLADAARFVTLAYTLLTECPVESSDLVRTIQEFGHAGIAGAVPRYFHSSSFRQEWIDRRSRLIAAWDCPVLLLQGAHDPLQPREFYEDREVLAKLPPGSALHLFDAGHFWPFEASQETVGVVQTFLES